MNREIPTRLLSNVLLGRSFVARAHQLQPEKFDAVWLGTHNNFLHLVEFQQLFPNLPSPYSDLVAMTSAQRRAWVGSSLLIVGNETLWVLSSKPSENQKTETSYELYDLATVNQTLGRIGLKIFSADSDRNCLTSGLGYCLESDAFGERARHWAKVSAMGSTTLILVALIGLLTIWSLNKGKIRKERLMILQILAHELRTPVTSMGISLELLRTEFDRLSPDGQISYLRNGAVPIILRLSRSVSGMSLSIEDKGHFTRKDFLRLKAEFRRGVKSTGMGLGLGIVFDTLSKLEHPIEFQENPTRFTIRFDEV